MKIKSVFNHPAAKKGFVFTAVIVGAAIVIGMSYWAGFSLGYRQTRTVVVQGVSNPNAGQQITDFSPFWTVWNLLKSKYVSASSTADNQQLMYGAIQGLVSSVGDPYTVFFDPKDAKDFQQEISGQFSGIGAEIGVNKDGQVVIIAPLKGTPAEKAGLMPQDAILKVNGTDTASMTVDEASNAIRGPKGTTVTLSILRKGWKTSRDFSIVRDTIQIPTLDFKMVNATGAADPNGTIAYIKLDNFYEQAPQLFYNAAYRAVADHARAIIVDLRNNPGGYLDGATAIGGLFIKQGDTIVTEAFRDASQNQTYTSQGPSILSNIPVAVLINGGSASAAEILAGALKDDRNALIMGQKSFGKGTVQQLFPISLGTQSGLVKITIAHWITPAGHMIDKQGIEPTVVLPEPSEQAYADNPTAADQQWITAAAKALSQQIAK